MDAASYAAVAGLPANNRRAYSAALDRGALSQLRALIPLWAAAKGDATSFSDRYFGNQLSEANAGALRTAANAIMGAQTKQEETAASNLLSSAVSSIGIERLSSVLTTAEKIVAASPQSNPSAQPYQVAENLQPKNAPGTTMTDASLSSPASSQGGSTEASTKPVPLKGYATFYNLPGSNTASGKPFDPNSMSAAMTGDRAPLGSTVTVQLQGDPNSSVIVKVNDTGPFARDAHGKALQPLKPDPNIVIDLTPQAFDKLTNNNRALGKVPVIVTINKPDSK